MSDEAYCPGCGVMGENEPCLANCDRKAEFEMYVPYTYTLPQQFIEDKEVPTRWRVWAVINGFFIGGQYCWASNEWIANKVKSHKDTVSQAVKELENKGIIRCVRRARGRDIYPMIGASAYQWSASAPISDRHQRLPISYSNSEKEEIRATRDYEEVSIQEESTRVPRAKDRTLEQAAKYWHKRCAEAVGQEPVGGLSKTMAVLKDARKSLTWSEIKHKMKLWFDEEDLKPYDLIQITRCFSSYQIGKYKLEYS